jgi:hypothetical protein
MRASSLPAIVSLLWLASAAAAEEPAEPQPATIGAQRLIHELRLGVAAHDVDGLWSGERKERGVDYMLEVVLGPTLAEAYSGAIRTNLGFTWNNRGYTSKAYGGLIWHWSNDRQLTFELGLGVALHTGERETDEQDEKQLGSKLLFRVPIELGWEFAERQRVSLFFEHVSNAWLADENEGMDLLGARWAWRF